MFVTVIPQFQKNGYTDQTKPSQKNHAVYTNKNNVPACVVLLDIDNTLGGNQGGIYGYTI